MIDIKKKIFHYIALLYFIGIGPILGFLPTIARHLGYSKMTYGTIMMTVSLMIMLLIPIISIIVDKFRVKKTIFLMFLLMFDVMSYLMIFVPKVPMEAIVELECNMETVIVINAKNVIPQQRALEKSAFMEKYANELIVCKVSRVQQEIIILTIISINN